MKIKLLRLVPVVLATAAVAPWAVGFTFIFGSPSNLPVKWTPATTSVVVKIMADNTTLLSDGTTRATAIQAAMQTWNAQLADVQFAPQIVAAGNGADGNGVNEVFFSDKPYNQSWDSNTLAITTTWATDNQRTESDTIFNTAFTWDSYRGFLRSGAQDLRRVALHELGHELGLDHPDQATPPQTVSAIMNSVISNIDALTSDDITGARSLYGAAPLGSVPPNDNFANAIDIGGALQVTGTNVNATRETGEPVPDTTAGGSTGGHSVWWKWTAPITGNVAADTKGSLFDTTLGVYTGSSVSTLTKVAYSDDVQPGVIRTSALSFSATAGTIYYFAVDGFNDGRGADSAAITLNLNFSSSSAPTISSQPVDETATPGGTVTFSVTALGAPLNYQWSFNGSALSGATSSTLTLTNVQAANAGNYTVTVSNGSGSVTSNQASLVLDGSPLPNMTVTTGHNVTLIAANAVGAIQWQASTDSGATWTNLSDGGVYSGTATSSLTLTGVTAALSGNQYRYVAKLSGNVSTSNAAVLSVSAALLPFPVCLTVNSAGTLFVGDAMANTIQSVSSSGSVAALAGSTSQAGSTDGKGASALFNQPAGIAYDSDGNVYVADTGNATIRRVATDGTVTTVAGQANTRGSVDGSGSAASFSSPTGLTAAGTTLYVADAMNNTIRKITTTGGVFTVSTFAGSPGQTGSNDGTGSSARFNHPTGVTVDGNGNVFVADSTNNTIRQITPLGAVTTIAGLAGVSGSADGPGSFALFNNPGGIAVDSSGNLYVADTGNSSIRKITPAGAVSTLAGLPTVAGLEDGTGGNAFFNQPRDLAIDGAGNLFVADTGNAAIRKVTPAGAVSTLALSAAATSGGGSSGGSGGGTTTTGGGGTSTTGSSSGGGGGGAMEGWLVSALGLVLLARCSLKRT